MKYTIPTIFITILWIFLIGGILNTIPRPKIENDDVRKCVIDTMYVTGQPSTIEYGKRYNYKTSCDDVILTKRNDVYKIGDTITYIYKKR